MKHSNILLMNSNEEIKRIADTISGAFAVNNIILFGSYAHGKPGPDSDIDLCIITSENKRKLDIIREIRKILLSVINKPLDILVYNLDEFNSRTKIKSTLEYKIKNEGVYLV